MSIKIGDLYVEIYPKVNEAARRAAMASLSNSIRQSAKEAFDDVDKRSNESANRQIADTKRTERETRNSRDRERTGWAHFWLDQERQGKKNEGIFHRMATNFRTIGTLIRGLSVGALVIQGFSTLLFLIQGIAATAPLIGAALVSLPAIIGGVVAEGLILKAAFKGVGKTIGEAFDPSKAKQFQQDLAKLAPSARAFVLELRKIKGVLPNIQQVFFDQASLRQASQRFRSFAAGISGQLKRLVAANGNLAGKILGAFTSAKGTSQVSSFLGNIATLLRRITPGIRAVTEGFISLANAVSGQGAAHGKGINQVLEKFGNFLKNIKVKQLFDAAIGAARGFGQVIGNVTNIIKGIGRALGGSQALGAQFFKSLIGITRTISNFVNSAAGQTFIKQLAGTLTVLSRLVNGAILAGLKLLAGFLAALYPALKPLGPAVVELLNAFIPLGPVIGKIAGQLAGLLASGLRVVTPLISSLVNTIAAHPGLFQALAAGVLLTAGAIAIMNKELSTKQGLGILVYAAVLLVPLLFKMGGAFKIVAIALGVAAAAWKLYTLAQSASGIGLIITAIGLLAVAIFELATHWKQVWHAIVVASKAVWGFLTHGLGQIALLCLGPVGPLIFLYAHWKSIWHAILVVTDTVKHSVLVTVNAIGHWFTVSVPNALKVLWANMVRYWNASLGIINIVKHGILVAVNSLVHWFTVSVPNAMKLLWANVARYWHFISQATGVLTSAIIRAFNGVLHFWTGPVYGGLKKLASFAASIWHTMSNAIGKFTSGVVKAFSGMVNTIRTVWAKIQNYVGGPIKWVVQHVYNEGIAKLWNAVSGVVGHVLGTLGNINLKFSSGGPVIANAGGGARAAFAVGGRVTGPGGPTEDLIPAMLSHGEYVIKASTVRQLGTSFFDALNAGPDGRNGPFAYGDLGRNGVLMSNRQHLASGGAPGGTTTGGQANYAGNLTQWLEGGARITQHGKMVKALHGQSATQVLAWLRSIAGRVPYRLGANGPGAFDCSSLVGSVWARLVGQPPNKRYFVTGPSEDSFLLHHGFKRGVRVKDSLMVGQNGEHTVGVLDGHRFEAAHTGTKMRFDDGATNALNMPQKYWMPTGGGGSLLSGVLGFIENLAGKGLQYLSKPILWLLGRIPGLKNFKTGKLGATVAGTGKGGLFPTAIGHMANAITHAADNAEKAAEAALAAAGSGGSPTNLKLGHGKFNAWVAQASRFVDIPASWLPGLLRIMMGESGGNPNAVNRTDSNARAGHPSQGLMQLIPSTYAANVPAQIRGWGIRNPVANLAAAVNYIHRKYGSVYNTPWYHGQTFYSKGGPVGGPLLRDNGGVLPPGDWLVQNHTGRNEYISRDSSEYKELHVHVGDEHFVAQIDDRIAKHDNDMIKYIITRHS